VATTRNAGGSASGKIAVKNKKARGASVGLLDQPADHPRVNRPRLLSVLKLLVVNHCLIRFEVLVSRLSTELLESHTRVSRYRLHGLEGVRR